MPTRLKILVVDDDKLALEMIGMALIAEGVDVLGLRDSWEANDLLDKEKFDGIFIDLTMPRLNGLELAARIRGSLRNATTPVVVITGREDFTAMKEAFSAGASFFLSKPLDLPKLRRLVNTTYGTLLRERRRNHRVPLAAGISCRLGHRSFTGMTSQISELGLVFHFEESLRQGDVVQIAFVLPTAPHDVEATGEIVRADDEHNTACHFKELDNEAREAVREFVASVRDADPEVRRPQKGSLELRSTKAV